MVASPKASAADLASVSSSAEQYFTAGKLAQALSLFVRAAIMAADHTPSEASVLWRRAGVCAHRLYDPDLAVKYFTRAVACVVYGPERAPALARLYANLTGACLRGCRLAEAYTYGEQAMGYARSSGNVSSVQAGELSLGDALLNLGLTCGYWHHHRAALQHFTAAEAAFSAIPSPSRIADALLDQGWALIDLGRLDEAEDVIARAGEIAATMSPPHLGGRIALERIRLRLARGVRAEAYADALRAADTATGLVDHEAHVDALVMAAQAAFSPSDALAHAETGLALALSLGRPPVLLELVPLVLALYERAGVPAPPHYKALQVELEHRVAGTWSAAVGVAVELTQKGGDDHETLATGSGGVGDNRRAGRLGHRARDGRGVEWLPSGPGSEPGTELALRAGRGVTGGPGHLQETLPLGDASDPKAVLLTLDLRVPLVVWLANGTAVSLSRNEYLLLRLLASRPNQCVEYDALFTALWGGRANIDPTSLAHLKASLAEKLDAAIGAAASIIETHYGVGLRLALAPGAVRVLHKTTAR